LALGVRFIKRLYPVIAVLLGGGGGRAIAGGEPGRPRGKSRAAYGEKAGEKNAGNGILDHACVQPTVSRRPRAHDTTPAQPLPRTAPAAAPGLTFAATEYIPIAVLLNTEGVI